MPTNKNPSCEGLRTLFVAPYEPHRSPLRAGIGTLVLKTRLPGASKGQSLHAFLMVYTPNYSTRSREIPLLMGIVGESDVCS
jgi:hypothetical protein